MKTLAELLYTKKEHNIQKLKGYRLLLAIDNTVKYPALNKALNKKMRH